MTTLLRSLFSRACPRTYRARLTRCLRRCRLEKFPCGLHRKKTALPLMGGLCQLMLCNGDLSIQECIQLSPSFPLRLNSPHMASMRWPHELHKHPRMTFSCFRSSGGTYGLPMKCPKHWQHSNMLLTIVAGTWICNVIPFSPLSFCWCSGSLPGGFACCCFHRC